MKVIIVGGVAGGASAAARLRRLDESAQIIMLERSGYVSYANCGLPYYIGGTIKEQRSLTLQTPASFAARFNVEARVQHEVLAIDRESKTVTVRDLTNGQEYTENYDNLILAPGARPVVPLLPGVDSSKIYTLRTVEDTLRLREAVLNKQIKSVAVVGAGFVGVEMAENLQELGLEVSLIQREEHILPPLDKDMASFLHAHMCAQGVKLLLNQNVTAFAETAAGIDVLLQDQPAVSVDMVVLAVGVAPETDLARAAGLQLGVKGSIIVNEHMQTSDADIYAVGDAVSVTNSVSGEKALIALAGPANKQGRIAADNIAGLDSCYQGSPATAVLKVFKMTAAFTGLNERAARAAGLDYEKIILAPASHASYYPGGNLMTIKLLFARDSQKIIGAQIVGFDGVDKRLDVLATAMQAGLTVLALKDIDLAYAPPYSSAKDPVNMAGFIAENVVTGKLRQFFYEDLVALPQDGSITMLDARTPAEYAQGHAEGFDINIPVDELRGRLHKLDKSKPVYVMCRTGLRSYIACRQLMQAGFECYNFAGGYLYYASVHDEFFDSGCTTECGRKA